MSNAIALPDSAPDYLAALIASNPVLAAANPAMTGGISAGMHPMIGTSGTRFVKKEAGAEEVIEVNGSPISVLGCVVLSAKPNLDKKLYLKPYDPKATTTSPDCQSSDGLRPDADCPAAQHETCSGCWANVFGSGKDQNGNPSKGKACSDSKKIAIFAAGKVYGFNVPPASLKNWAAYYNDLKARNIPIQGVITSIGFDLETPQILTFKYAGALAPEKVPQVIELISSKEVQDIVTFKLAEARPALPAPAQPTPAPTPAPEAPPAPPKRAAAKKTEPAPAQTPDPFATAAAPQEVSETAAAPEVSDDAIKNLLGL